MRVATTSTYHTALRVCAILLCLTGSIALRAVDLSDSSQVSLLTCTPGAELYSCFGHSGIRVRDSSLNIDVVFNYGTFDYEQPGFYANFVRGHMIYMLGLDRYEDFRRQYADDGRGICEQVMNLSKEERNVIFHFLINNEKEENRNYRYDFLFDNCATRIRDVFEKNLPGVRFDYSRFTEKKSFRDLINDYSADMPWEQFGMGLLIGLPVDRIATHRETMFLPDYLSQGFRDATIHGRPLCRPRQIVLSVAPPASIVTLDRRLTPTLVFGILLLVIIAISVVEEMGYTHYYTVDYILLFAGGLLGVLIFWLGACTEHTTTQWNLNLLWALPTHLALMLILPFMKWVKWVADYFLMAAILCALVSLGWWLLPQHFLFANALLAATFGIRNYRLYRICTRAHEEIANQREK